METEEIREDMATIDMDEELEVQEIFEFVDKVALVGKRTKAIIEGVAPSIYKDSQGKPKELIVLNINGVSQRLDLNKTNLNWLVKNVGKTRSSWIGKEIVLMAESGMYVMDGNEVQGVKVYFTL